METLASAMAHDEPDEQIREFYDALAGRIRDEADSFGETMAINVFLVCNGATDDDDLGEARAMMLAAFVAMATVLAFVLVG